MSAAPPTSLGLEHCEACSRPQHRVYHAPGQHPGPQIAGSASVTWAMPLTDNRDAGRLLDLQREDLLRAFVAFEIDRFHA